MLDLYSFVYGITTGFFGVLIITLMVLSVLKYKDNATHTIIIHVMHNHDVLPECLICLEPITKKESLVECSSCRQPIAHLPCMIDWTNRHPTCPHCQVVIKYEWTDYTTAINNTNPT